MDPLHIQMCWQRHRTLVRVNAWGTIQDSSSDRHQPLWQPGEFKHIEGAIPKKVFVWELTGIPVTLLIPWIFLPHKAFALLHMCNLKGGIQEQDMREGRSGPSVCHSRTQTKSACWQVSLTFMDQYRPVISALLPRAFWFWNKTFSEA